MLFVQLKDVSSNYRLGNHDTTPSSLPYSCRSSYKKYDYPSHNLSSFGHDSTNHSPAGRSYSSSYRDSNLDRSSLPSTPSSISFNTDRHIPSSSLSRYTGSRPTSSYTSQFGSGYAPDVSHTKFQNSYAKPPLGQKSYALPSIPSTCRTSRPTFGRSTSHDFGTSYTTPKTTESPSSAISRSKGSHYNLTPFESRLSNKDSCLNHESSSITPRVECQTSSSALGSTSLTRQFSTNSQQKGTERCDSSESAGRFQIDK